MFDDALRKQAQDLIARGELKKSLELLQEQGPREGPRHRQLLGLSCRLAELTRQRQKGLLTGEAAQAGHNRITDALLELLSGRPVPEPDGIQANARGFRGEVDYAGSVTKSEAKFVLTEDYAYAFRRCRAHVREVGGIVTLAEEEIGQIRAHRIGNPLVVGLLGQKIMLWLRETGDGQTEVEVIVDNGQTSAVTDWGSNRKLLDRLLRKVRQS